MYNDNIEILKMLNLNTFDIDYKKTTCFVDPSSTKIEVHLYLNQTYRNCKFCKDGKTWVKDTLVKKIHHPVIPNRETIIYFHQKKYYCIDCGRYSLQFNPLVEGSKNITILGELYILEQLRRPTITFSDLAKQLNISIQSVIRTFDDHVSCDRKPLTKVICIDENYLKRLSSKKFCCIIYDPISNTLLDILDTRLKYDLIDTFSRIPISERMAVKIVNMDMYKTYRDLTHQCFPNAIACVDSFHVIKNLNEAMQKIRISVQKSYAVYKKSPDPQKSKLYWMLKSFHYYFVENFDNIKYTRHRNSRFSFLWDKHQVLNELLKIDSDLTEAYYLKESYREFNLTCDTPEEAKPKLEEFIDKFKKSPYEEFRNFGSTLSNWHDEIINSFLRVDGKRMNNGPMESINGRLDRIISDGYGYTNFNRFRNRAMYVLNKDTNLKNF